MKLTKVQKKISDSTRSSIYLKCHDKTYFSASFDIWNKIRDEIGSPNIFSIERLQRRILNNLQDEIN